MFRNGKTTISYLENQMDNECLVAIGDALWEHGELKFIKMILVVK